MGGNLYAELAKSYSMAVVPVPGHVLEASIHFSRTSGVGARPQYIHCDSECEIVKNGDQWEITRIDGEVFEKEKIYHVSTQIEVFTGLYEIKPLRDYIKA